MKFKIQDVLRRRNEDFRGKLEKNFDAYFENYQELLREEASKIQTEQEFLKSKIKVVEENKVSEEEMRKQQKFQREIQKQRLIESKLLSIKKKRIEELLKLDPNVEVLNKKLSEYVDDEIVQMDFFVFKQIKETIEKRQQDELKRTFDKKFALFDHYKRQELESYFKNQNDFMMQSEIDIGDVVEKRKQIQEDLKVKINKIITAEEFTKEYTKTITQEATELYQQ